MALTLPGWWSRTPEAEAEVADADGRIVQAARGDVRARLTIIGELHPVRSTTISSNLGGDKGTIISLADDGVFVEAGEALVRLDRAPFEEALASAEAEVARRQGQLELKRIALDWEISQAEKAVKSAEFELELAGLEQHRFEKGDGPLELARLQGDAAAAAGLLGEQELFVSELEPLLAQGFVQQAEIDQLVARRDEARRSAELTVKQAEAYELYIYPSRKAALDVAVNRATAALAQVKVSSESKVAEARASVQLAERDHASSRAAEDEARKNLERTVIRAPSAGMFVLTEEFRNGQRRKPRVGDAVWEGQQIAFLPDLSEFEVRSNVREVDLHRVRAGYSGRARFDAYPDLERGATVRGLGVLASRITSGSSEKTFAVTVDLEGSDPRLRPGMTARVEIDAGSATDVLVLPLVALWEEAGETFVWVETEAGVERRDVTVGLRDHQGVEILDGIGESDRIRLDGPR